MFTGFPEETIHFFLDLRFHNETSWFHSHREEYDRFVRKPFFDLIEDLASAMRDISEDIELRPGRCLARINRDIRFTRDKSPYRDHLWFLFRRAGEERDQSVMYWFELSPENTDWGLGFWGRNRTAMDVLRRWMETKPSKMTDAFANAHLPCEHFGFFGDCYQKKKIPESVPEPLKPFYPMKEIYLRRMDTNLTDAYRADLVQKLSQDFLQLKPVYLLFREAADQALSGLDM